LLPEYRYTALCQRVIDGDTFMAVVDLGFYVQALIRVRVHGLNCPEVRKPWHKADPESPGYKAAQFAHRTLVESLDTILLQSYKDERSFERWVCDVWIDGQSYAEAVIKAGRGTAMT